MVELNAKYARWDLDLLSGLVKKLGGGLEVLGFSSCARTDVNTVNFDIAAFPCQFAVVR